MGRANHATDRPVSAPGGMAGGTGALLARTAGQHSTGAAGQHSTAGFLRNLGGRSAPCRLAKLVLLGEQLAGKISLADSLVRGRPTTRPADDRTAAEHRVYRVARAATRPIRRRLRRSSSGWRRCSRRRPAR